VYAYVYAQVLKGQSDAHSVTSFMHTPTTSTVISPTTAPNSATIATTTTTTVTATATATVAASTASQQAGAQPVPVASVTVSSVTASVTSAVSPYTAMMSRTLNSMTKDLAMGKHTLKIIELRTHHALHGDKVLLLHTATTTRIIPYCDRSATYSCCEYMCCHRKV
jgi:hypothetical protein